MTAGPVFALERADRFRRRGYGGDPVWLITGTEGAGELPDIG